MPFGINTMYRLDATDSANEDFESIIAYIVQTLCAPKAASEFADKVLECYERIEENPYLYAECQDAKLKMLGYRKAVIKNYVMLYKVYEDTHSVIVQRFFYGGQNYAKLI